MIDIKKIFFRDEQEASVNVAQTYEVRWKSRYDNYASSVRPEVRVFTTLEDAEAFAEALRDAFKLIRHTAGDGVKVTKAKV